MTDDIPGDLLVSNAANPSCWGALPFAHNLRMVADFFGPVRNVDLTLKPSHLANKARPCLRDATAKVIRELTRSKLPLSRRPLQNKFATAFKEALLRPTCERLLESRFVEHFAPVCSAILLPAGQSLLPF